MYLVDLEKVSDADMIKKTEDLHLNAEEFYYFSKGWMSLYHELNNQEYFPKVDTKATLEKYKGITFTGQRILVPTIKAKIKDAEHIRPFFDGTPGYQQATNITIGKEYEIFEVIGFGDVADAFVIGDNGQVVEVMIDWFE